MLNGETQLNDENLLSWAISDVSPSEIDIYFRFKDLLSISQGDDPDLLVIKTCPQEYSNSSNEDAILGC